MRDHGLHWSLRDAEDRDIETLVLTDHLAIGIVEGALMHSIGEGYENEDLIEDLTDIMKDTERMVRVFRDNHRNLYRFGEAILAEHDYPDCFEWCDHIRRYLTDFSKISRIYFDSHTSQCSLRNLVTGIDRYLWFWFTSPTYIVPCYNSVEHALELMYERAELEHYLHMKNWLMDHNVEIHEGDEGFVLTESGIILPMGTMRGDQIARMQTTGEYGRYTSMSSGKWTGFINHDLQTWKQRTAFYTDLERVVVLYKDDNGLVWQRPRYWGNWDAQTGRARTAG